MNDEQIALARRAVACRGWRWMPGMLIHYTGLRKFDLPGLPLPTLGQQKARLLSDSVGEELRMGNPFPDINDPATLGCLISLVQEIYNKKIVVSIGNGWWSIQTDYKDWDQDNTSSILEGLILAMEHR